MNIAKLAKSGKFVVTTEVGPPKGVNIEEMLYDAELMRGKVDAINVTDQQSSVMRLGSLAACHLLPPPWGEGTGTCLSDDLS